MIVVLSPEYLATEVGQKELALAIDVNKRLVPTVARDLGPDRPTRPAAPTNELASGPA